MSEFGVFGIANFSPHYNDVEAPAEPSAPSFALSNFAPKQTTPPAQQDVDGQKSSMTPSETDGEAKQTDKSGKQHSSSGSDSSDDSSSSGSDSESGSASDSTHKSRQTGSRHNSESQSHLSESHHSESHHSESHHSESHHSESHHSEGSHSEGEKNGAQSGAESSAGEGKPAGSDSEHSSGDASHPSRLCGSKALAKLAEEQPDLYGIRRSCRQRKEPTRLTLGLESDSDSGKRKKRGGRKGRKDSSDWGGHTRSSNNGESTSEESSFSDGFRPAKRTTRTQAPKKASRQQRSAASRRTKRKSTSDGTDSSDDEGPSRVSSRATQKKVRCCFLPMPPDSHGKKAKDTSRTASQRKASKKSISYKEDTDDATDEEDVLEWKTDTPEPGKENDAETIEKMIRSRIGRKGATGSKTTLYNLQQDGQADPNEGVDLNSEETETQYLVKWKNWSHIHNTWESIDSLTEQKVNGMKKLENFKKRDEELNLWKSQATPEDLDYFECQDELNDQLYETYCLVERVVTHTASRTGESKFPDYLVKWRGLPYSECTWEDGELIINKFHWAVEEYNKRNKSQRTPNPKYCKAMKSRPKFTPLKDQPEHIGSEELILRDYQMAGLNWLLHSWSRNNSVILADEMGLGKTIQTISFVSYLMHHWHVYGPYIVVVPLSTIVTWSEEFKRWAPDINVVIYLGDVSSRNKIREYEWCHPGNKRLKFNVLITTYEILLKDKTFLASVQWACLAVDEAHRLKNDDSLLYRSLVDFKTNHRMLITGTPLQNSLKELWSLLHFIMPHKFDDWSQFEEKHSTADRTGFSALHKQLEPYLLRRVKKDVEKSLPAKTEQILRVEMSNLQKQFYKWILTKNYKALSRGMKGSAASFINIVMELKKCCNHGFLIRSPEGDEIKGTPFEMLVRGSGKLLLLDKLLLRLKETGHRVLIFSQMVRMLDLLSEYLTYRHFQFQRLDGGIRGEIRKQALDHFNAEGSTDFCFLLSTRAGGLGLNLATADTVIIFDSDWNPQNDLQAQARAHRIGQKNQVSVYRLVTKGSVEEDIVERAKRKMVLDHLVIQRMDTTGRTILDKSGYSRSSGASAFNKEELTNILQFGAEELFKETEEEDDLQVDIDEILKRAETRETEDHSSQADDLLSQFKVVSFDNLEDEEIKQREDRSGHWDKIIPQTDRERIEEEEKQAQLLELNLGPRQRKQVTQFNFEDSDEESRKRRKQGDDFESEGSDDEGSSDEEKQTKKRGRGQVNRTRVKGFTDAEVRRFVKSYKKFGRPKQRLEVIACDAELQEKSAADLQYVADLLHDQCQAAMDEYESKSKDEPPPPENTGPGRKANRGPSFKLGGVMVNAKSVIQAIEDLEPLYLTLPEDKEERNKYQVRFHVKYAHWDCPWETEDDTNLLKGIYEYGMGSWEAIKMDPSLQLHDKILPDGDLKPQAKHLQTRAEYLIKLLQKHLNLAAGIKNVKQRKPRQPKDAKGATTAKTAKGNKGRNPKVKSAEIIENTSSDEDSNADTSKKEDGENKKEKKERKEREKGAEDEEKEEGEIGSAPSSPKKKKKKKEKKDEEGGEKKEKKTKAKANKSASKPTGPMHFTAHQEPVSILEGQTPEELPEDVFAQCKEKMRPVKKSLRILDKPPPELTEREQLEHTKRCLLKIGDHIAVTLAEFKEPDLIKQWRNNLWIFVSKFTEFEPSRLHKIYKHAMKKRDEKAQKASNPAGAVKDKPSKDHTHVQKDKHKEHSAKKHGHKDKEHLPKDHSHKDHSHKDHKHKDHSSKDHGNKHHKHKDHAHKEQKHSKEHGHKRRPADVNAGGDHQGTKRPHNVPDSYSDTSRDSFTNGPRYGSAPSHGANFRNAMGRGDPREGAAQPSGGEEWQQSPLARGGGGDFHKNRYTDAPNAYTRPPGQYGDAHRGGYGQKGQDAHFSEQKHRYNNDHRRDHHNFGNHFHQKGPGGYGGPQRDYWRNDRDPRSRNDQRQDYGSYGARPPGDDYRDDRYSHSRDERKRKPNDYTDWDRRPPKDAKMMQQGEFGQYNYSPPAAVPSDSQSSL